MSAPTSPDHSDLHAASVWNGRVDAWEEVASSRAFLELQAEVYALAAPSPSDRVLDLGVGTGLLALALAPAVEYVYGLDTSPAMLARFRANAEARNLDNVRPLLGDIRSLPLPDESITLAVSNYTFHHVPDPEKELALSEVRRVLRPGGRLVVCDMMFALSLDSRDRTIVLEKTLAIARRGPAGLMRLARNAARVALGHWEHPAREDTWERMLRARHFDQVEVRLLRHEAGVATAVRPSR